MIRYLRAIGLTLFWISLFTDATWAANIVEIPSGATDSEACGVIERAHAMGIERWRANDMAGALAVFEACEVALKKRSLWTPPKLPKTPTLNQLRSHIITNSVIFSLASLYQKMNRPIQAERYAEMARERGILPRVVQTGQRGSAP